MDLDVENEGDSGAKVADSDGASEVATVRQGEQDRPFCPIHICLMVAENTSERVTRYKCKVPGCKEKAKKARPRSVIPADATECPMCAQRSRESGSKKAKPVYCVADRKGSHGINLKMACPTVGCGYYQFIPQMPGMIGSQRRDRGDISAR